jgi:hypothetical protein
MANEDSRDSSVLGGALKLAAIGGSIYGAKKGVGQLIRHYDDLGSTWMGGAGDKVSNVLKKGVSAFDKDDGTNVLRKGLEETQEKLLTKDVDKYLKKTDKILNKSDLEMSQAYIDEIHEDFKGYSSIAEKRDGIRGFKDNVNDIKQSMAESLEDPSYTPQDMRRDLLGGRSGDNPIFINKGGRKVAEERAKNKTVKI